MKILNRLVLALIAALAATVMGLGAVHASADDAAITLTPVVVVSPVGDGTFVTVSQYTEGANGAPAGAQGERAADAPPRGSGIVAAIISFLLGAMVGGALMRLLMRPKAAGAASSDRADGNATSGRRATATTTTGTAAGATAARPTDADDRDALGRHAYDADAQADGYDDDPAPSSRIDT